MLHSPLLPSATLPGPAQEEPDSRALPVLALSLPEASSSLLLTAYWPDPDPTGWEEAKRLPMCLGLKGMWKRDSVKIATVFKKKKEIEILITKA